MTHTNDPIPAIPADLVIVGAGMAGLYSAWRVLQRDPARSITILESLDRTGGRLQTDHITINGTTVKTEEGGMRFLTSHVELVALLKELGLWKYAVPFSMGDDKNLFYLRGRRFTRGDAAADPSIWSSLYALNASAQGQQPGAVLSGILNQVLEENGANSGSWKGTPDDWTTLRLEFTWRGIPLYRWGFWALLTEYGLSPDAIDMLYESSGFIAPYDQEINAGSALQLLVDFVNPEFHTLGPGYELLPTTLATLLQPSVDIRLQHQVTAIEREASGTILVTARRSDGSLASWRARDVVLAVTQVALQQLSPFVPMFRDSAVFSSDVDSVTDMDLGKINLYFDRNWWTPATGIWGGGSWTDAPLAQFYCFGDSPATPVDQPASVTLYTDFYRTGYWDQLQRLGKAYAHPNGPLLPPAATPASEFVVAQAMTQLRMMLNVSNAPDPVAATYRRWGLPPAGDGDHQWRIDVRDDEVRARLANPFPNVYTCGETWSDDQAWVNGALRSANTMLSRYLKPASRGQ
jgi:protoporphyrinogen oxidase